MYKIFSSKREKNIPKKNNNLKVELKKDGTHFTCKQIISGELFCSMAKI